MQTFNQNPFLGLKPYESGDRERLFGRDKDLFLMMDRICSARTTLLFAGSGVGKTSFINAKIIPELEDQEYCVIYHNEWAQEPLAALLKSVTAKLSTAGGASPASVGSKSLLEHLGQFTKSAAEDSPNTPIKRGVIILDQFEEIFQYHSHKTYFQKFINDIAGVVNTDTCNARILFAMREEFLGELSVFDNKIPDLFSNYYRLKCPNKHEAANIIKNTAEVPVNVKNLGTLVNDLAKDERGAGVLGDNLVAGTNSWERDIVEPPYLQIACQGLWDQQFSSGNGDKSQHVNAGEVHFLADYQSDQAHEMLRKFLGKHLLSFKTHERALLADAFDYLVTKKGAKMAYELSNLAELMGVKESALKPILFKLSEARILRKSIGQDLSPWFELYHDRYARIIDDWKREYRLAEKAQGKVERKADVRRGFRTAAALVLVFAFIGASVWTFARFVRLPWKYRNFLLNAELQKPDQYGKGYEYFNKLRDTWGWGEEARKLWSNAWMRRAYLAEKNEDRSEAFLSWLTAAAEVPPDQEAALLSQIGPYLGPQGYESLLGSFPIESDGSPNSLPIFSADGKGLSSVTNDMRVSQWDTISANPLRGPILLELDDSSSSPRRPVGRQSASRAPGGPPNQGPTGEMRIQAAAGNLLGGINGGRLHVWRADTGARLWASDISDRSAAENDFQKANYGRSYTSQGPSVSFTPDGRYFAALDQRDSVQLYSVNAEQTVVTSSGVPISSVARFAFSPISLLLIFNDNTLKVQDLKTSEAWTQKLPVSPRVVAFSPDGSRILTGPGQSGEVQVWNIGAARPITVIKEPLTQLASLSFCDDNKTIAVSLVMDYAENKKVLMIKFFDSDTGNAAGNQVIVFDDLQAYIVNPDGTSILTLADPGVGRLWSLTPSKPSEKVIKDSSRIVAYNVSENGQIAATINESQIARNWNTGDLSRISEGFTISKSGSVPASVPGFLAGYYFGDGLVVSPQGSYSCLRNRNGQFVVWDVKNNREVLADRLEKNGVNRPISFSANDEMMAVGGPGNVITLWRNLAGGPISETKSLSDSDEVNRLVFSPDGKYLAAFGGYSKSFVKVFEVTPFKELAPLGKKLSLNEMAFGRNGKAIVSVSGDDSENNAVLIWDLATGPFLELPNTSSVTAFTLNPDGTRALTSSSDGNLQLWDTSTGDTLGAAETYNARIRMVKISADGKTAIAFTDNWVHLSSITGQGLEYYDGRLINSLGLPRMLDETGRIIRKISQTAPDYLEIEDISFVPQSHTVVILEKPSDLLERWKKRLWLSFDDRGHLRRMPNQQQPPS